MGMFPYTCDVCGGGYNRCGNPQCKPDCEGGQMCWEEECYVLVKGTIYEGKYDGYGRINVDNSKKIYIPIEFQEFIDGWYRYNPKKYSEVVICDVVYCKSCY